VQGQVFDLDTARNGVEADRDLVEGCGIVNYYGFGRKVGSGYTYEK
jgi:hypothetical protein